MPKGGKTMETPEIKYNQILDDMIIKSLNDAFIAGRSKQSFGAFKEEWVRQNYFKCCKCNCIVPITFMDGDKTCYLCSAFKPIEKNEVTPQERKQVFEDNISPFIRYGYNSALIDIEQYMVSIMEQYDIDTLTVIQNKIHEMMESKKLIDTEKLSIELKRVGGI